MTCDDITCPKCGTVYHLDDCWSYDEADWPDEEPTLFPAHVVELPCGHSVEVTQEPEPVATQVPEKKRRRKAATVLEWPAPKPRPYPGLALNWYRHKPEVWMR